MVIFLGIGGYLYFRISGQGLDIDKITNSLGVQPQIAYKEGDTYKGKYGVNTYEEDCWMAGYEIPSNKSFESATEEFFAQFTPSKDYIRKLSECFEVKAYISLYPEEEQFAIHLNKTTISILNTLETELSISFSYIVELYHEPN